MTAATDTPGNLTHETLRRSESRYRRLFESAQDGILLLNARSAQIEDVNPYLIRMLGYSHTEFLGKKLWEVGAFADIAQSKQMFAELQTAGFVRYDNLPLKTKAGAPIDVEFVSNAYDCEGLKVIQCNIRDITDRTAAEAQARLRTRLYAALSECNKAIVHCTSVAELFPRICRIAVLQGGMRMAWIGMADLSSSVVRAAASFGDDAGYLQDIRLSLDAQSPFGRGPTGTAIRENRPVWSHDSALDPSVIPWHERRARSGFSASASLPLHRGGAVIGALSVYASDTQTFDGSTRELLLEMATDISFALDGFDREAQRNQAEAALIEREAQLNYTERMSNTGGWSLNLQDHSSRRTTEHDRIFGYDSPPAQWTYETFLEHVLPEDRVEVNRNYQDFVSQRAPLDFECRIRRVDGELRWIRTVSGHRAEVAGGTTRVSGMVQDITERRNAAQVLHASQQRLQGVLTSAMDAIVTADDHGVVVLSNPAAEKMFGYTTQQLQGRALALLMPERFRAAHAAHMEKFGKSGVTNRHVAALSPIRGLRSNGEEFPVEVAISMDNSTGRPLYTAILRDITERERAAAALQESRNRLVLATESAQIGIWDWDVTTSQLVWDARMYQLYGIRAGDLTGAYAAWQAGLHPESLEGGRQSNVEFRIVRPNGEMRYLEGHAVVQRAPNGAATRMTGVNWDITARKLADIRIRYLNRVLAVLSGINSLIVRVRSREHLFSEACNIAVNIGGFRMSAVGIYAPGTKAIALAATAGKDPALLAAASAYMASPDVAVGTLMGRAMLARKPIVCNDSQRDARIPLGEMYAERGVHSIAVFPLIVADEAVGAFALYAGETEFFHAEELKLLMELAGDIAFAMDHIRQQERLEYFAYFDALTELANRTRCLERVTQYMRRAVEARHKLAVLVIDLERFRNFNDSLGRLAGDSILQQVGQWLTRTVGDAHLLARVGPDQFAVVMPVVQEYDEIGLHASKLMDAFLQHQFHVNEATFRLAAKVGVALFPDHGGDADTVFRHAEAALKKAKAQGDRLLVYTHKMTEAVAGKLKLETQLREALEKGEFVLHYQPKVNIATSVVTGAEALIRWNDPRTGLVPPGQFIPILEETGLIYEVGRWALRTAIEDYLSWRAAGLAAVRISVNVSPLQLRDRGFITEIERTIGVAAHGAAGLELEITESLIMEDVKHSIADLKRIRAMGVSIAIDDFGTGFSSLSYLAKLPIDTLKIDRSFVVDMADAPEGQALVAAIITLAHGMRLKVVAEGVESWEQSQLLLALGCDEMQGFLFSKPVPRATFEANFLTAPATAPTPPAG